MEVVKGGSEDQKINETSRPPPPINTTTDYEIRDPRGPVSVIAGEFAGRKLQRHCPTSVQGYRAKGAMAND